MNQLLFSFLLATLVVGAVVSTREDASAPYASQQLRNERELGDSNCAEYCHRQLEAKRLLGDDYNSRKENNKKNKCTCVTELETESITSPVTEPDTVVESITVKSKSDTAEPTPSPTKYCNCFTGTESSCSDLECKCYCETGQEYGCRNPQCISVASSSTVSRYSSSKSSKSSKSKSSKGGYSSKSSKGGYHNYGSKGYGSKSYGSKGYGSKSGKSSKSKSSKSGYWRGGSSEFCPNGDPSCCDYRYDPYCCRPGDPLCCDPRYDAYCCPYWDKACLSIASSDTFAPTPSPTRVDVLSQPATEPETISVKSQTAEAVTEPSSSGDSYTSTYRKKNEFSNQELDVEGKDAEGKARSYSNDESENMSWMYAFAAACFGIVVASVVLHKKLRPNEVEDDKSHPLTEEVPKNVEHNRPSLADDISVCTFDTSGTDRSAHTSSSTARLDQQGIHAQELL